MLTFECRGQWQAIGIMMLRALRRPLTQAASVSPSLACSVGVSVAELWVLGLGQGAFRSLSFSCQWHLALSLRCWVTRAHWQSVGTVTPLS